MPSKRKSSKRAPSRVAVRSSVRPTSRASHVAFFPILILTFIFWLIYRGVFQFPLLFDELVGKAIFFGLPVWLYVLISGYRQITETFAVSKLRRGLMLGISVGGVLGFAATIARVFSRGGSVMPSFAFESGEFWWQFSMAIVTSFWETLFFFSFVMLVIQQVFRKWSLVHQALLTTLVFVIFHLPNTLLRFQGPDILYQVALLTLFALGQSFFFATEKNGYSLVLSQTLWGLVLLLHF